MFLSIILFCLCLAIVLYLIHIIEKKLFSPKISDCLPKFTNDAEKRSDRPFYDVAIVGAGPSGATCAYYLATTGRRVLLLEKKKFPRDKACGDAVCKTAIEILQEMGVYQKLIDENKAHVSDSGGMVSPGGLSFIGRSKEMLGEIPAAIAVKRTHLDEAIAMAAKEAGADLREDSPVGKAVLDKEAGLWKIEIEQSEVTYQARLLVCADGATSRLATQLGLVTTPPTSTCSRSYVEGGTHNLQTDGVVFYPKDLLPGYAALFRHPNNELNYCVYIIPGNPAVTSDDLPRIHEELKNDPFIGKALGDRYKIERMKAGSLRLGGEKCTYDDHVIVIGDAAGMIDPMTGEGIHHAMDSGKLASKFLCDLLQHGNYDCDTMKIWQDRWMEQFGSDFYWSWMICQLLYRYPILLDASTMAVKRKGDRFLARWADIMTGRVPKFHLLRPEFVIVITYELICLLIKKYRGQKIEDQDKKDM